MTYGQLADELGMPNARNLNFVLGAIGNALVALSKIWKERVPPLEALVVTKATGVPGEGFSPFAGSVTDFRTASPRQRRQIVDGLLAEVYRYSRWEAVLHHYGLALAPGIATIATMSQTRGGPGESQEHKRLKTLIAEHPAVVGLHPSTTPGETEFQFGSADAIDVLFKDERGWVGVEVKPARSDVADITRGLFQCVKYHALIEATQRVQQVRLSARVILALESPLPDELVPLRNVLGIEVCDGIEVLRAKR